MAEEKPEPGKKPEEGEEQDERRLSPEGTDELMSDGAAQVVDVRDEDEHAAGHIPGDVHIPLARLEERAEELDRSKRVVLYCRSGERSAMAAEAFAASGWDAYSVDGGLLAWAEAGRPLEPEDGEVAARSGLPPP